MLVEEYKILGVDEHAAMDDVKKAYEDKVKKFSEEIQDPRKLKKFINLFDKAYEAIKEEREKIQNDETVFMKISDIEAKSYLKNNESYNEDYEDYDYEDEDEYYEDEFQDDDFEDYEEDITSKRKNSKGKDKLSILEIIEKPFNIIEKYIKDK